MTHKPSAIFLSSRFPYPLDRGDRLRAFHLVKALAEHAETTLVSFTDGDPTAAPIEPLLEFCNRVEVVPLSRQRSQVNMLANLHRKEPFQVAYYRSDIMERLVDRLRAEKYDVAFGHLFRMRPYLDRFTKSRRFLDLSDSLALNLSRAVPVKPRVVRPAFEEELRRVDRYERESLKAVDENWVISETDRDDLLRRVPEARIAVVPNGIDLRWGSAGLSGPKKDEAIFLGNLTVGHNVDAVRFLVESIWPKVIERRPEAVLRLVGVAGETARKLAKGTGVSLEGFVPDLAPILERARLAIAPLRYGAGVQNKVLETMAAGLPTVVTPLVNEPIGAAPDRDIVVGQTAEELSAAILRLFDQPGEALAIANAGRNFVTGRYSWDRASERFGELLG